MKYFVSYYISYEKKGQLHLNYEHDYINLNSPMTYKEVMHFEETKSFNTPHNNLDEFSLKVLYFTPVEAN